MNAGEESRSEVGERLRWWIAFVGFVLGGWGFVRLEIERRFYAPAISAGLSLNFMDILDRLLTMLGVAGPVVLVVGCWGFGNRRPWGRGVLLTYVAMKSLAVLGSLAIDIVFGVRSYTTMAALVEYLTPRMEADVWRLAVVVLLTVLLTQRGLWEEYPDRTAGFEPVVR